MEKEIMRLLNSNVKIDVIRESKESTTAGGLILTTTTPKIRFQLGLIGDACRVLTVSDIGKFVEVKFDTAKLLKNEDEEFYIMEESNVLAIYP